MLVLVGCGFSQGLPVTALHEVSFSTVSLPWLAYRSEEAACGLRSPNRLDEHRYRSGCYFVPSIEFGEVLWGVTQAVLETKEWRMLLEEVLEPDEGTAFLIQVWSGTLLRAWTLTLKYPLEGEARFVTELSFPSQAPD